MSVWITYDYVLHGYGQRKSWNVGHKLHPPLFQEPSAAPVILPQLMAISLSGRWYGGRFYLLSGGISVITIGGLSVFLFQGTIWKALLKMMGREFLCLSMSLSFIPVQWLAILISFDFGTILSQDVEIESVGSLDELISRLSRAWGHLICGSLYTMQHHATSFV